MKFSYILILVLVCGCSIQKRHHLPGWDVQWKKKYSSTKVQGNQQAEKRHETELPTESNFRSELDSLTVFSNESDPVAEIEKQKEEKVIIPPKKQIPLLSAIQNQPLLSLKLNLKDKIPIDSFKNVNEKPMTYNGFFWLMMIPSILLLIGGVCALIFGQNGVLLVAGIILLVLSVLMMLLVLFVRVFSDEFRK